MFKSIALALCFSALAACSPDSGPGPVDGGGEGGPASPYDICHEHCKNTGDHRGYCLSECFGSMAEDDIDMTLESYSFAEYFRAP